MKFDVPYTKHQVIKFLPVNQMLIQNILIEQPTCQYTLAME